MSPCEAPTTSHVSGAWWACASHPVRLGKSGAGRWFGVCFNRRGLSYGGVCSDPQYITAACGMVAEMVECLPSVLALGHKRNSHTPAFLTPVLRNIVISLARLPLVNSYTRVPPLVSQPSPGSGRKQGRLGRPPTRGSRSRKPRRERTNAR